MRRHWVMNTSSCPILFCASHWLRATTFAMFFRIAVISIRFWLIMLAQVMISQPRAATCGIQFVSSTLGFVMGRAFAADCGRRHRGRLGNSCRYGSRRGSCRAQNVSVDVEVNLGRCPGFCRGATGAVGQVRPCVATVRAGVARRLLA